MYQLQEKRVEGQTIVLDSKDVNYLGPNLVLQQCRILIRVSAKGLTITRTTFRDCEIAAKTTLLNFSFCDSRLQRCTLTGKFFGCDFGRWLDNVNNPEAGVFDCDFSAAKLDASRFIDCDVDSLKFPPWPGFTIINPRERSGELEQLPWPGRIRIAIKGHREDPPQTCAVTYFAPELIRRLGGTEEELKKIIKQLDGVIF